METQYRFGKTSLNLIGKKQRNHIELCFLWRPTVSLNRCKVLVRVLRVEIMLRLTDKKTQICWLKTRWRKGKRTTKRRFMKSRPVYRSYWEIKEITPRSYQTNLGVEDRYYEIMLQTGLHKLSGEVVSKKAIVEVARRRRTVYKERKRQNTFIQVHELSDNVESVWSSRRTWKIR